MGVEAAEQGGQQERKKKSKGNKLSMELKRISLK